MSYLKDLLCTDVVKNNKGEITKLDDIKAKYVMVYISASWCPPCRGFTPQLIEFYNKHKASKDFEVIFFSWDEEEDEFDPYFKKMPWLAVPFETSMPKLEEINEKLKAADLGVETIPTVLTFEDGKFITRKARAEIPKDPEGNGFPYTA